MLGDAQHDRSVLWRKPARPLVVQKTLCGGLLLVWHRRRPVPRIKTSLAGCPRLCCTLDTPRTRPARRGRPRTPLVPSRAGKPQAKQACPAALDGRRARPTPAASLDVPFGLGVTPRTQPAKLLLPAYAAAYAVLVTNLRRCLSISRPPRVARVDMAQENDHARRI